MKISFMLLTLLLYLNGFAQQKIGLEDIRSAEKISGIQFTDAEIDSLLPTVNRRAQLYRQMHGFTLENAVPPALVFRPLLPDDFKKSKQLPVHFSLPDTRLPANKNELAFYSIPQLASLLQSKQISSVALTTFFIHRLKEYGDTLKCVVSLTEELAMKQARKADKEIASGNYRGLLHGIPYGLKDLFAVKNTRTTWGAAPYKNQVLDYNSYVYTKLKDAGAVLVAKLSMGALAMGDYWFGGLTKNPWNLLLGSSGSSAGPAAATVAGLIPFSIGTETYGSIISPSTVCGATGLRPTFGSISRYGAMALAWSLDKIGPICRSAADAAVVFHYLHGTDGRDNAAVAMPFNYSENIDLSQLKIGYAQNYFDEKDTLGNDMNVLAVYRKAGVRLIPMVFPDSAIYPLGLIGIIIGSESSAAFDEFTRTGLDDQMKRQGRGAWPNYFRASRFIPAAAYINANRHRYLLMQQVNQLFEDFDAIICPSWAGNQLAITNLTGHPAVCFPTGFRETGSPTSITIIGKLHDEATILEIARLYQMNTEWNKIHPEYFMD